MVSFECSACNDTLKKPKLVGHLQRCRWARFTCIDCNVTFEGTDYQGHTSCISEDQKYQKSVYKAPKAKGQQQQQQQQQQQKSIPPHLTSLPVTAPTPAPTTVAAATPVLSSNGIHPDRLKFHENSKPVVSNKRGREDAVTVPAPVAAVIPEVVLKEKKSKKDKKDKKSVEAGEAEETVTSVAETELLSEEPRKKKSKKEAKQEKFAKKADVAHVAVAPVVIAVESCPLPPPASVTVKTKPTPTPTTVHPPFTLSTLSKPYTLSALLQALFPTLLSSPTSIASILTIVQEEAKKAGFTDEKVVTEAFMEGLWLGGASLKKIKTLTMKF